jgi:hypothetical protein
MISLSLIATSFLVSLVLVVFFRFASMAAASFAFISCICHFGLWGAFQSIYLRVFAPERAEASIGLGNPISAGIIGGLVGVPFATIVFLISLIVGFFINKYRSQETPFETV